MKTIRLLYLQIYVNIIGLPVYCEINKIVKTVVVIPSKIQSRFQSKLERKFQKEKEIVSINYEQLIH